MTAQHTDAPRPLLVAIALVVIGTAIWGVLVIAIALLSEALR